MTRRAGGVLVCVLALTLVGCRAEQDMADQPRYDPLEPSAFFPDGRAARPVEAGTIARGQLRNDPLLYTGKTSADARDFADEFPFEIDRKVLERGKQRYDIFCSVCHGYTGHANGVVVQRGYLKPPDFSTEEARGYLRGDKKVRLTEVPVGYLFEVITKGYGGMPDYRAEIKPRDRWAVVAYLRALQMSQTEQRGNANE